MIDQHDTLRSSKPSFILFLYILIINLVPLLTTLDDFVNFAVFLCPMLLYISTCNA